MVDISHQKGRLHLSCTGEFNAQNLFMSGGLGTVRMCRFNVHNVTVGRSSSAK